MFTGFLLTVTVLVTCQEQDQDPDSAEVTFPSHHQSYKSVWGGVLWANAVSLLLTWVEGWVFSCPFEKWSETRGGLQWACDWQTQVPLSAFPEPPLLCWRWPLWTESVVCILLSDIDIHKQGGLRVNTVHGHIRDSL